MFNIDRPGNFTTRMGRNVPRRLLKLISRFLKLAIIQLVEGEVLQPKRGLLHLNPKGDGFTLTIRSNVNGDRVPVSWVLLKLFTINIVTSIRSC